MAFKNFSDFYVFYLGEHAKAGNKIMHFIGSTAILLLIPLALFWSRPLLLVDGAILAYACAWFGHFFFENNRPATFKWPIYSLLADFKMYFELLTLRRRFF